MATQRANYRVVLAGLLLPACLPIAADASEICSRSWLCVGVEQKADNVELYARNLEDYPVTLSVRMRASDLPSSARRTATRTVDGGSRAVIKRFPASRSGDYRFYFDWTVGRLDAEHDKNYLYRLPFATEASYRVLQGNNTGFSHNGLEQYAFDFDMPRGTPVYAARGGVVAMLEEANNKGCWESQCSRHANYLVILHDDGTTGEYYHLQRDGVLVERGERVARGQLVARSGNTGHTTMAHLHFAVYRADRWGRTQSVPIRFATAEGALSDLRQGRHYRVR